MASSHGPRSILHIPNNVHILCFSAVPGDLFCCKALKQQRVWFGRTESALAMSRGVFKQTFGLNFGLNKKCDPVELLYRFRRKWYYINIFASYLPKRKLSTSWLLSIVWSSSCGGIRKLQTLQPRASQIYLVSSWDQQQVGGRPSRDSRVPGLVCLHGRCCLSTCVFQLAFARDLFSLGIYVHILQGSVGRVAAFLTASWCHST